MDRRRNAFDNRIEEILIENRKKKSIDWTRTSLGSIIGIILVVVLILILYYYLINEDDYDFSSNEALQIARGEDNRFTPFVDIDIAPSIR